MSAQVARPLPISGLTTRPTSGYPLISRLGLAGLFLVAGVACFVLASNYFYIWPTNDNPLYQGSLAALFLAAALAMRRTERLKALWPLAYAFFVATMVWLITSLVGGFGNWALRLLNLTGDTPAGMAVAKVGETLGTVIIILGLSRLAGWTPASLLLRRGDLKWALVAGSLVIVNFATAMLMVSVNSRTDLGALGQLIVWGLVFSAANGFMEELWFRGLFIGRLAPHVGASGAVVLTALVFALMHVSAFYFSPQVIPVFLLNLLTHGLVLGWLIFKTDSLWGAVLYHLAMDLWLFIGPLGSGG